MTQQLSILTGCSAGATVRGVLSIAFPVLLIYFRQESFVVVPFELVKIKWVLEIIPKIYCQVITANKT